MTTTFKPETRVRLVFVPAPRPRCCRCDKGITAFHAGRNKCVVVNRYEAAAWVETLIYHVDCYEDIGSPFGPALVAAKRTGSRRPG